MPTYEYECLKCGNRFEVFQKMTEKPFETCLKCQGKINRLIGSGSGIIFKGSGFYATDYRKKPKTATTQENKSDSCTKDGCQSSCRPNQ